MNEKAAHQQTMINDLTSGSVVKKLLIFAAPIMLSNLLQVVYNLVDMIVIGQFIGSVGLSAVTIGGQLLQFLTGIGMGLSAGGQILISQYVGRREKEQVSRMIGNLFTIGLSIAIAVSVLLCCLIHPILNILNTPEEAYSMTFDYTLVCFIGAVFIFGYNIVSAILRGMGDSKHPLLFVGIASGTNLVLDLLLVAVFHMGTLGAALATVIGQALSFIVSIIYLYCHKESFGFDFKTHWFKPNRETLGKLVKLSLPMMLQFVALDISMLFCNAFINSYGVTVTAVTGIGSKYASIASVVTMSVSTAGGAMAGQCFGAGKYERIPKIMLTIAVIGASFVTVLSAILLLFPEWVFSLFDKDTDVLSMCRIYVPAGILSLYGFPARGPFMAIINGQGNSRMNLLIGLIDGVLARTLLSLLLAYVCHMEAAGFWYGSAIAGYAPLFIGGVYYWGGFWKKRGLAIDS